MNGPTTYVIRLKVGKEQTKVYILHPTSQQTDLWFSPFHSHGAINFAQCSLRQGIQQAVVLPLL